ncbi:MAG: hypothetical protein KA716_11930 [Gloeotrichia echinulata DEX184]|nr:hypothetical protein [Gloeotrichia echinulata DEX184]
MASPFSSSQGKLGANTQKTGGSITEPATNCKLNGVVEFDSTKSAEFC